MYFTFYYMSRPMLFHQAIYIYIYIYIFSGTKRSRIYNVKIVCVFLLLRFG